MSDVTKITLTVENPKHNTRYYVVAQPIFTPPVFPVGRSFLDNDETVDSDDTRKTESTDDSEVHLTVPLKQVRNTQPHCSYRSCGRFCKRGARFCVKCEEKCTNERQRVAMERAERNK